MRSCRDVATVVASGHVTDLPWPERAGIWLHVAMCRHCRAFGRQIRQLTKEVRVVLDGFEEEIRQA